MNSEKKYKILSIVRQTIAIICLVIGFILFGAFWFLLGKQGLFSLGSPIDLGYSSQIGDFLGGVAGSLWTVAGILLLYETLVLQRKEFYESKKDILYTQSINTFFKLLDGMHDTISKIKGNIKVDGKDEIKEGRDFLHYAFLDFAKYHQKNTEAEISRQIVALYKRDGEKAYSPEYSFVFDETKLRPYLENAYNDFYKNYDYNLGHFYRYIFNVIKFIVNTFKDDVDTQKFLVGLMQAQLTNDELGLMFYNALSEHGRNKHNEELFKSWLDNFNYFENIDERCVLNESYIRFYPKTSFKFIIRKNA